MNSITRYPAPLLALLLGTAAVSPFGCQYNSSAGEEPALDAAAPITGVALAQDRLVQPYLVATFRRLDGQDIPGELTTLDATLAGQPTKVLVEAGAVSFFVPQLDPGRYPFLLTLPDGSQAFSELAVQASSPIETEQVLQSAVDVARAALAEGEQNVAALGDPQALEHHRTVRAMLQRRLDAINEALAGASPEEREAAARVYAAYKEDLSDIDQRLDVLVADLYSRAPKDWHEIKRQLLNYMDEIRTLAQRTVAAAAVGAAIGGVLGTALGGVFGGVFGGGAGAIPGAGVGANKGMTFGAGVGLALIAIPIIQKVADAGIAFMQACFVLVDVLLDTFRTDTVAILGAPRSFAIDARFRRMEATDMGSSIEWLAASLKDLDKFRRTIAEYNDGVDIVPFAAQKIELGLPGFEEAVRAEVTGDSRVVATVGGNEAAPNLTFYTSGDEEEYRVGVSVRYKRGDLDRLSPSISVLVRKREDSSSSSSGWSSSSGGSSSSSSSGGSSSRDDARGPQGSAGGIAAGPSH